MSSQQPGHPISPPPVPASPPSQTGVRRHHTISASSRRASARPAISEETQEQEPWNDDEVVDQDWVGGVGVVGEKSSLNRQRSLPTRYHRGMGFALSAFCQCPESAMKLPFSPRDPFLRMSVFIAAFQAKPPSGTVTPRTMNSLSAIAGHEGDEDDWEREMRGLQNDEEVQWC